MVFPAWRSGLASSLTECGNRILRAASTPNLPHQESLVARDHSSSSAPLPSIGSPAHAGLVLGAGMTVRAVAQAPGGRTQELVFLPGPLGI